MKVKLINYGFDEDEEDSGRVIQILDKGKILVQLLSDPSIFCIAVEISDGLYEILENIDNFEPEKVVGTKQELLECIQNFMGLVDTPTGRRNLQGEFADECRKIGRNILDKNGLIE